jgi:2,3-bisphosphoglycerate-independent phosphoglycerate mutase
MKKQIALIILDGWGYSEAKENNAIAQANTPNFDKLWQKFPHCLLSASGLDVGLPEGQMGNSEVGHMTIGAGRSLDQDLVRIKKSIESGEFAKNPALVSLFEHVKKHNSVLHALGILSPGGVHGHMDHLFAFLKAADNAGIKKVAIHVITDGRDDAPQDAGKHIEKLENFISELGIGFIASISGRSYAMDRDKNWDRTEKSKKAIFECEGNVCSIKPSDYVKDLYQKNLGNDSLDEHIVPTVCMTESGKGCAIGFGCVHLLVNLPEHLQCLSACS